MSDHSQGGGNRNELVEMELPRWMVKQLRGSAIEDRNTARTELGREDAQKIISLLTHYLDEDDD